MSGVTDSAFRRIARLASGSAVGLMVTEFISVEALTRDNQKSFRMMRFHPEERPLSIQLFGADPDRLIRGAALVEQAGADVLDINCGCPAPKVVSRGGGCELMRQPEHLYRILVAIRREVGIPVTLKMRSGWDDDCRNAAEIAVVAEAAGLSMIAVHGRTRVQLYRGSADWSIVEAVRRAVRIPVVASGDITSAEGALEREARYRPDGMMIGRGALVNPWIFRQIEDLRAHRVLRKPSLDERIELMRRFAGFLEEDYEPHAVVARLRQFVGRVTSGLRGGNDLRRSINDARSKEAILDLLLRFADLAARNDSAEAA
jgi:nifR3 family TIM-barrel protein